MKLTICEYLLYIIHCIHFLVSTKLGLSPASPVQMYRITMIILVLFAIIFVGCAARPKLSPIQIRQITTKLINGTYEETYRSALTVLQDQGYIIKNTDMESGLIMAQVDRATSGGSQFVQALFSGYVSAKGTDIEVRCVVNKLSNTNTEIRVNIQETKYGQSSFWGGTSKQKVKQIYGSELFRNLFFEIEREVKRRQAINGMSNQNVASSSMGAVIPLETAAPHYQQNLESIMAQHQNLYFNIIKILRNYVLIQSDSPDDFDIGKTYEIVSGNEANYVEIGRAKVVLKKGSTIALQVLQSSGPIQINDTIKYSN